MNKRQEERIKMLTGFSYDEIIAMDDIKFYKNITKAFVKGKLTPKQYKWLEHQRLGETTQTILKIFGGTSEKISKQEYYKHNK